MELHIRNIDPKTVQKIDGFAKKRNLSRNEYLKILLETYTAIREFRNFEDRYNELVQKVLFVIDNNTEALLENTKTLQQLQEGVT